MTTDDFLRINNWSTIDVQQIPSRDAEYHAYLDLGLSSQSISLLRNSAPNGVYLHQKKAIEDFLSGNNVCLTTSTASGKSLIFYLAAIEKILNKQNSKILAIYPLRALGSEQEERWKRAFSYINLDVTVGRIDGLVPHGERENIIKRSQLLVVTPDIIHAWILSNLDKENVIGLFKEISLIVIDEIHNYSGVFGSNSSFLFRRIQHIMKSLGSSPQYIAASATIANPDDHLQKLIGVPFKLIDNKYDTSPKQEVIIKLIEIPQEYARKRDFLSPVSQLIENIVNETAHRFICFVDSRKQTEYISSIVARLLGKEKTEEKQDYNHLQNLSVLPYRSGYELEDRSIIQARLSEGNLRGVVSTSALELGIDIQLLDFGILVGVPRTATALNQRIGRIARHLKGEILIINDEDIYSRNIFRNPRQLLSLPLSEGGLYLENPRIQYIHALCLARQGGEHDKVCAFLNKAESLDLGG
jgi:DEAD/DEAH box helicase domain-containing protein